MSTSNLPAQATPFLGRAEELAEIADLLADPTCRFLTLVGPGGMGKTRLALEAARQFSASQGVYFVPLQPLDSATLVISAIAETLDFQFYQTGNPQQQLLDYLREKSLLLVLDNFEHLLDGAYLVTEILAHASGIKALVTSREALNLQEEWVYPVKGMRFPQNDRPTNPEDYSAVRLFAQHARRIRADFSLAEEELGVVRICALVEGMPLGIELAAAWVRTLSCAEIADEVQRSLDILATPARNAEPRHRNMRAVLDHSWHLLTESERAVFEKLVVFRDGFTRQAAQAIAGSSLPTLAALVDKSFLRHDPNERYDIHELLRQYGEEQLNGLPEQGDQVREQHCRYYAGFMQQRELDVKGRRQLAALREIEAEFENVRSAWLWALRQKNYAAINQMLESLSLFCEMQGRFVEGMDLIWQAQAQVAVDPAEGLPLMWGHLFTHWAQLRLLFMEVPVDAEMLQTQLEQCLALAQTHGKQADSAHCWWILGLIALLMEQTAQAISPLEKSLALYSELEDYYSMAMVADYLAPCYLDLEQPEKFGTIYAQSLRLRRQIGDQFGLAMTLNTTAVTAFEEGHFAEAERTWREIGAIHETMGNRAWLARNKVFLATLAFLRGDFDPIRTLEAEVLDILPKRTKPLPLALLGMLANIEEDYLRGRQLCKPVADSPSFSQVGLAVADYGLGEYPLARQHLQSALKFNFTAHQPALALLYLPIAALLQAQEGDLERAAEVLGLAFQHPASETGWLEKWPLLTSLRTRLETDLGSEVFGSAWQRGKSLDLVAVIHDLRAEFGRSRTATPSPVRANTQVLPDPLTERELEVLRLLTAGRSNREIAERLVLALGTVKWYVSEIYSKLGVSSRTQAMARAGELKLLS